MLIGNCTKLYKQILLIPVFFLFLNTLSFAQSCIDSLELNRIFQPGKKKFIHNRYLDNVKSFDELNPSCVDFNDSSKYNYQYDTYFIKENINKVWLKYKSLSLSDTYSGHIVSFGFMYSKKQKCIIYLDSNNYKGMREGQVFFINLDLLGGLKKLIVAYEVTKIDDANKSIQFCYINNGISEGSQKIILSETKEGYTKVQHNTIYRSQSKLRDKYFYPQFHKLIVKELHKNLMITL